MIMFLCAPQHRLAYVLSQVLLHLFHVSLIAVLTGPPVSTVGTSSSGLSKTRGKRARESPDLADQDPAVTDEPADEPADSSRKRARTVVEAKLTFSNTVSQSQPEAAATGEVQASAGLTAASLKL